MRSLRAHGDKTCNVCMCCSRPVHGHKTNATRFCNPHHTKVATVHTVPQSLMPTICGRVYPSRHIPANGFRRCGPVLMAVLRYGARRWREAKWPCCSSTVLTRRRTYALSSSECLDGVSCLHTVQTAGCAHIHMQGRKWGKQRARHCECACCFCRDHMLTHSSVWERDDSVNAPIPGCIDKHAQCKTWATNGECKTNAGFMLDACPQSCPEGCPAPQDPPGPKATALVSA